MGDTRSSRRKYRNPPTIDESIIRRVQTGPIPIFQYAPPQGPVPILFEDESFVVVNKPAGLLSVPGIAPEKQDCTRSRIQSQYPNATGPLTVHRLDLSTSGIMILALNPKTHKNLSKQFEDRQTAKRYLALIEGHLQTDQGTINTPIRKDMDVRPLMLVDHLYGKPSTTHYTIIAHEHLNDQPVTRIELIPHTGRTHQLRIHCAHPAVTTVGTPSDTETTGLNAPIVGDELYGHNIAAPTANRLMLHASMLTIHHPITGKQLTFKAPDPF
ncbi:MAG: RluA family pseudouridine synthase [Phycisphaerales bacterium]|nr:RluA family pseudouridine synthase [Phycisphaerales bacterium]